MDLCHLKNSELEKKFQKYKGRVALRGDVVKDDSGLYAVFTEQGSSAPHRTAAKALEVISRLPRCAGQATHAVYRLTLKCKWKTPENGQLTLPESKCPTISIRLPRSRRPNSWDEIYEPVVPLERKMYGHPLTGLLWERQFDKVLVENSWRNVPHWECFFVHRENGWFLSVYVDNLKPMWDVLIKQVDLGAPTSQLDQAYFGCAQRDCKPNLKIAQENTDLHELPISGGIVKQLVIGWSCDMEGHAKKCVERYCGLVNKKTKQFSKSPLRVWMIITAKKMN